MPHVICWNISSRLPTDEWTQNDIGWGDLKHMLPRWRKDLRPTIITAVADLFKVKPEDIQVSFPHDPDVPSDPYPVAQVYVENLESISELQHGHALCDSLARILEKELDRLRQRTGSRVSVTARNVSGEGFRSSL